MPLNRREDPRIEIQLRCHVSSPAIRIPGAMHTETISRSGLAIAWRDDHAGTPVPRVGQLLTVEVELPTHHGFGQKCMHCQGTVSRVAGPLDGYFSVALTINYMDFRSFDDRFRPVPDPQPAANGWMV